MKARRVPNGHRWMPAPDTAGKYTAVNLGRLVWSLVFLVGVVLVGQGHLWPISVVYIAFSLIWFVAIQWEYFIETRHSWSGFIPGAVDACYATFLIYLTGNVQSFLTLMYPAMIVLSSLDERPGFGRFTAVFCGLVFSAMAGLVGLGLVPSVNVLGNSGRASGIQIILASIFVPPALLSMQLLVRQLIERLHAEVRHRREREEIVLRELELARRVQEAILPKSGALPAVGPLTFASRYLAMESVGGDTYDIVRIGPNACAIYVADVSGHGVAAAMVMTMLQATFRSLAHDTMTPAEAVSAINQSMFALIGDLSTYVTLYYLRANLDEGRLYYVNAGHQPAILLRRGQSTELDTARTFFVGVLGDYEYETSMLPLEPGDRIVLLTDGLAETRNGTGRFYGEGALEAFLSDSAHLNLTELVGGLMEDASRFSGGRPPHDDRAIVALEFGAGSGVP